MKSILNFKLTKEMIAICNHTNKKCEVVLEDASTGSACVFCISNPSAICTLINQNNN